MILVVHIVQLKLTHNFDFNVLFSAEFLHYSVRISLNGASVTSVVPTHVTS